MDFGFGQKSLQREEARKISSLKEALESIPQEEIPQETTKVITVKYKVQSYCGCGGDDETEYTVVVELPSDAPYKSGQYVDEAFLEKYEDNIIDSYLSMCILNKLYNMYDCSF